MNEIISVLKDLIRAVKNSAEYERFIKSRAEIRGYPDKLALINEFRLRNFRLQNTKEEIDLYEESDRLNDERRRLSRDKVIGSYLEAEVALCRIVQKINLV